MMILSFTVLGQVSLGIRKTAVPMAQTGGAEGVKFLIKSALIVLSENYKALELHCCRSNYKSWAKAWAPLIKWQSGTRHVNVIVVFFLSLCQGNENKMKNYQTVQLLSVLLRDNQVNDEIVVDVSLSPASQRRANPLFLLNTCLISSDLSHNYIQRMCVQPG